MLSNIILGCLVLLCGALVAKCRANGKDIETLFRMVRVLQGLPPTPGKSNAPTPDAKDIVRTAVDSHEARFHKR